MSCIGGTLKVLLVAELLIIVLRRFDENAWSFKG